MLDDELTLYPHVNYISIKMSWSVGILYKLRDLFPISLLKSIYNSLIYPYMNYAVGVWYNAPAYIRRNVEILQKKAIRVINNLDSTAHTIPYFIDMKVLPLSYVFKLKIATYIRKTISIRQYNERLLNRLQLLRERHGINTRFGHLFLLPRFNRVKSNNHIHYTGVKLWNVIPPEIKAKQTIVSFMRNLKIYF